MFIKPLKRSVFSGHSILISLLVCFILLITLFSLSSLFVFEKDNFVYAEQIETIYITDEQSFESFLVDCSLHNLFSRGENDIQSLTYNRKYILTTDIYLKRKNYDNSTPKNWNAQYFDGIFDGRGHYIVGFELDNSKQGLLSATGDTYGYAFFSLIGEHGIVKNLNFVAAKVDFLDRAAAIVAGTNAGTIENVKSEGYVRGKTWASGICTVNFGSINNSLSLSSVILLPGDNHSGTAGYVCAVNSPDIYLERDENMVNYPETYVGLYVLTNNQFYDMGDDNVDSLIGYDINQDGYLYKQNIENIVDPTNESYIWNYLVSDYYGVIWYLQDYKSSFETDPLISPYSVDMINDINLLNVPIDIYYQDQFNYSEVLTGYTESFPYITFVRNSHNFYNREIPGLEYDYSFVNGISSLPSASVELAGSGTKDDPYLISSVSDILKCDEIETNYPLEYEYYRLSKDISLISYDIQSHLVNNFLGEFDGNGYSISGILRNLFYSIIEESTIKNLRLSGKNSAASGLLCYENNGNIIDIDIDFVVSADCSSGISHINNGLIHRSSVRIFNLSEYEAASISWVQGATSEIIFCRSMGIGLSESHTVPFIGSDQSFPTSKITYCTNINNLWNEGSAFFDMNAWMDSEMPITSELRLNDLIDNSLIPIGTLYHAKGWQYAKNLGYAFRYGTTNDIPELVFPSDNRLYKLNSYFQDSYLGNPITTIYGSKPAYTINEASVSLLSVESSLWPELEEINGPDDEDDLRIGMFDESTIYISLESNQYIMKSAIEWILLYGLNTGIISLLNPIDISWEKNNVNWEGLYLDGPGEYEFYFYSDLIDLTGRITISTENLQMGILSFIRKDYSVNLYSIFYNTLYIGIPETEDISKKVYLSEGEDLLLLDSIFIREVGNYVLRAEIVPSAYFSGFSLDYSFIMQKGNLTIETDSLYSSIGGLSPDDAPTYSGNQVSFEDYLFVDDLRPGYSISVDLIKLTRVDGSELTSVLSFLDAGKYSVNLRINADNYNEKTLTIDLYIKPKEITLSLTLDSNSINFCQSLPNVNYNVDGEIYNYPLSGKSYSTAYTVGSSVGNYNVTPKILNGVTNYNYLINFAGPIVLSVNKINLDFSNVGFSDTNIEYDGIGHSLFFDKTKIIFASGDLSNPQVSCTYKYLDLESTTPFSFTDSGVYYLQASINAGANYNLATLSANVTINRRAIKLYSSDATVVFGDPMPNFSFLAVPVHGELSSELIINQLNQENHDVVLMCYYDPQSSTGWPDKLVNSDYYELPILLSYSKKIYRNLEIADNTEKEGILRVNRVVYSGELISNSIEYTGNNVVLSFKDGLNPHTIVWSEIRGGIESNLDNPPKQVSQYIDGTRPNSSIYRFRAEFLGNYKYKPSSTVGDFDIMQVPMQISGLYFYVNETMSSIPLGQVEQKQYIGENCYIRPDYQELPTTDTFKITINCNGYSYLDLPIVVRAVGAYSQISMEISCQGVKNYADYFSPYSINLEVLPREGMPSISSVSGVYINQDIQPIVHMEENFLVGNDIMYPGFFGYSVNKYSALNYENQTYVEVLDASISKLKLPGLYVLDVWSNDPNYKIGTNNLVEINYNLNYALKELDLNLLPETQGIIFEETYLNLRRNYLKPYDLSISLGDGLESSLFSVEFIINSPDGFIEPGEYDIVGAKDILFAINDDLFISCIKFSIASSSGKERVIVEKREVYFDWSEILPSQNEYAGEAIDYIRQLNYIIGDESAIKLTLEEADTINLYAQSPANITRIIIAEKDSRQLFHAGVYTLVASCEMSNRFKLKDSLGSQTISILPIEIDYFINEITLFSGDSIPMDIDTLYTFSGNEKALSLFLRERNLLEVDIATEYNPLFETEGEVVISPHFSIDNGGVDYIFFHGEEGSPSIAVELREFETISFKSNFYQYTGSPISLMLMGAIPAEAFIEFSENPTDAGTYLISATIRALHYKQMIFSDSITISKAIPIIEIISPHPRVLYRSFLNLDAQNVNARAVFNGNCLSGEFEFIPGQVLKYGVNQYEIEFFPSNSNFSSARSFYSIESYMEEGDISLVGQTNDTNGTVITDSTIEVEEELFTISLAAIENLPDEVFLYVNGVYIYGGTYSFYEDSENVLVEVRTSYGTIYSTNLNVLFSQENGILPINPENDNNINIPDNEGDPGALKTGEIVGIAVGSSVGAIGLGLLIFFIIKRKIKPL